MSSIKDSLGTGHAVSYVCLPHFFFSSYNTEIYFNNDRKQWHLLDGEMMKYPVVLWGVIIDKTRDSCLSGTQVTPWYTESV